MRRRRHLLQVSTFPFLAVLLCTMGSLLMLLLVIDRRAKIAAKNRALVELAKTSEDQEKTKAARLAEREKQREALRAEREAKLAERGAKRLELEQQHGALVDSVRLEQDKAKTLEEKTQTARHEALTLQQKLHAEIAALERASQALKQEQAEIQNSKLQTASTQSTLARMTADLESLEQSLADLKAGRKREQQTYSLVPYKGKRGDNRRPLYVECTELGIIFHPDKKLVVDSRSAAYEFRHEVEERLAKQIATIKPVSTGSDQAPYLFVMVRPNGITSYYHFLASLGGMKLDFGYEFIEPDWILDFTNEEKAAANNSWNTADQSISGSLGPRPTSPIKTGLGKPIVGLKPGNTLANGSERLAGRKDGARSDVGLGSANDAGTGNTGSSPSSGTMTGTIGQSKRGSPSASGGVLGNDDGPTFGRERDTSAPRFGSPSRPGGSLANSGGSSDDFGVGGGPGRGGPAGEETSGGPRTGGESPGGKGSGSTSGSAKTGFGSGDGNESQIDERANAGSGGSQIPGSKESSGLTGDKGNSVGSADNRASASSSKNGPQIGSSASGGGDQSISPFTEKNGSASSSTGNGSASAAGSDPSNPNSGNVEGQPNTKGQVPSGSSGAPGPSNRARSGADPSTGGGQGNPPEQGDVENQDPANRSHAKARTPGNAGSRSAGNGELEEGSSLIPPSPFPGSAKSEKKTTRLPRLSGNRDWFIPVECNAEGVSLPSAKLKISRYELSKDPNKAVALVNAVKTIIDCRQAAVRADEPAFRPQLRFIVQADGLRTYHQVYPILETLKLPMTRQDVAPPEGKAEPAFPVH